MANDQREITPKNIQSRVLVLVHDMSSECALQVYQNSYGNGKTEFQDFSRTFYIFQGLNFFQFCIILKNEKNVVKCAQNSRCTSSICEQSSYKVSTRNENFWSYRLHNLGILDGRTDGWTEGRKNGPTTRPAFAK